MFLQDFLGSIDIVHRDVAARNILLTENKRAKVCTFPHVYINQPIEFELFNNSRFSKFAIIVM
jgi:RIO-like serine/threonine protein kinase